MAHCTNPDCRHRQRTGKPAEYRPGATHCADCGEPLEPGEPPPPPRAPRRPWPTGLSKRLGLTLAAMVAVTALAWLPHPLVDTQAAAAFLGTPIQAGPFALGLGPLVTAFVLVELGALILPFTRHRRRRDPILRRRLWMIAAVMALGLAWLQGLSLAWVLENMNYGHGGGPMGAYGGWGPEIVARPGWAFRLATAGMCVVGTGLIAVLVRWLDRRGLGPGMAALLLAETGALLARGMVQQGRMVALGESNLFFTLLLLLALSALAVGTVWLLGRRLEGAAGLPAALPTCGLMPYEWALTLLLLPATFASFGLPGAEQLMDWFLPGRGPWIAVAIPVALLGAPLASTLFYWRRRQWWTDHHRPAWLRAVAASAGAMLVVVLADASLLHAMPMAGAGVLGWIALVALLGDAWDELLAWHRRGGEPREISRHQDVADALEELDALQGAQPDARFVLTGLRYRSLTYFFGPWVPLRILRVDGDHPLEAKP